MIEIVTLPRRLLSDVPLLYPTFESFIIEIPQVRIDLTFQFFLQIIFHQLRKKINPRQSFNLIDELTVFENVELPMLYTKVPSSERKRRVEELLEGMNIMHRRNHFPQQLSGVQQ